MRINCNFPFLVFLCCVSFLECRNFDLSKIKNYTIGSTAIQTVVQEEEVVISWPWVNTTQSLLSEAFRLDLYIDPPEGFFSSTALGVFMRCISQKGVSADTKVYYTLDDTEPTKYSPFTTYEQPYVHIITPFRVGRYRLINAVCIEKSIDGNTYRSTVITRHYVIEGAARPLRYEYKILIP
jgi:hypothetical protein